MASNSLSFSNASGKGSDFTICTLYGLPTIPANATLDNVMIYFNISRSGGGSNGEVRVQVGSNQYVLLSGFGKTSATIHYDLVKLGLIRNNGGVLTYTNDGSTTLHIRGYHDYWLFGASTWNVSNISITANYTIPNYTITAQVKDSIGGSVSGGGTYASGSTATLIATPTTGWKFKCWQDDINNTNATRTVTVTGNATYTAVFEKLTYRVRWYNEDGSVLLETDSAVPYGDSPSYNGTTPTKQGNAQHSYEFIGWNINTTSQGTTDLTSVVTNIDYYARFREIVNTYTVTWKNDDGTTLETDTLVPYGTQPDYNGETPKKASTSQYHYTFLGWSADVNDEPLEDTELEDVTGNIVYTAVYLPVLRKYTVTIEAPDPNTGTITGAVSGEYEYGTKLTLTANPKEGYYFDGWVFDWWHDTSITPEMVYNNPITFTVLGEEYVSVRIFEIIKYRIEIGVNDSALGEVTGAVSGEYTEGTELTLTAKPKENCKFIGWSDGETSATRTVEVYEDATYTALFEKKKGTVYLEVEDKDEFIKHITLTTSDGTVLDLVSVDEYGHETFAENILDVGTTITLVADRGYYALVRVLVEDYDGCLELVSGEGLVPGDYCVKSATFIVKREGVSSLAMWSDVASFNGIYADGRRYWFGSVDEILPEHIYADGTKVYGYWEESDDN